MNENKPYKSLQIASLVILRFIIGWHLLYEGVAKLLNPNWTSEGFLRESQWIMSGINKWIVSHHNILSVVDLLNTWGLIAIGLGLILGLFSRTAAISGFILLFTYYLSNPPLVGMEYSIPADGNNLIFNKTLIEAIALFVLFTFPTSQFFGFDYFIQRSNKNIN